MTDGLVKYMIRLRFTIEGVVERADVIGAIFGQTEGLFGPEMNLNELQKNWKIGRIEINLRSKNDITSGEVLIPASTDITTAALIAAAIESVDKVGPCSAKFQLVGIEDIRMTKRKQIVERAKEILRNWASKTSSEGEELMKEVSEALKPSKLISYGPEQLPAGRGIHTSDTIILVEGRADVLNLLKAGYDNVLALNGVKVPESVIKLGKEKRLIAFLDGDRGGDLIQKELAQMLKVEKIIRAPQGKEVEDLTPVEIKKILEKELKEKEVPIKPELPKELADKAEELFPSLKDTLEAVVLDGKLNSLARIPVSELVNSLQSLKNAKHIIFDGIITQRLIDSAKKVGVSTILGYKMADGLDVPKGVKVTTFSSLGLKG